MMHKAIRKKKRLLSISACLLAVWCAWRGFAICTGRAYYGAAERIYGAIPLLHTLDIACAALFGCLVACLLAGCTALLRQRERLSHGLLAAALAGCLAVELLYGGLRWLLTALSPLIIADAGRLAAYILLILVNSSYYKACTSASSRPSGGEANEEYSSDKKHEPDQPAQAGQNPLCGGSLLSGGGGAAGDGKASA